MQYSIFSCNKPPLTGQHTISSQAVQAESRAVHRKFSKVCGSLSLNHLYRQSSGTLEIITFLKKKWHLNRCPFSLYAKKYNLAGPLLYEKCQTSEFGLLILLNGKEICQKAEMLLTRTSRCKHQNCSQLMELVSEVSRKKASDSITCGTKSSREMF